MSLAKGARVSRRHLHNFSFDFVLFYYRLWFSWQEVLETELRVAQLCCFALSQWECESESESEWFIEKGHGPKSAVVMNSQATLDQRKASQVQHLSRQRSTACIKILVWESSESELEILVFKSEQHWQFKKWWTFDIFPWYILISYATVQRTW